MPNELDEMNGPINKEGRDVNVIEKQLPAKVGFGSVVFEVVLWLLAIIPGLVFLFMKINAKKYFNQLQQKIQNNASQIDNYLEQRVQILQNVVGIVEKSIDLDKDVMKTVAAYRGGVNPNADQVRNEASAAMDGIQARINLAFEADPELRAQENINDAMRQNSTHQKEITAARVLYNDTVSMWNQDLFSWPTKIIVAAKQGYTTRIPYTASVETKAQARGTFF